MTTKHFEKVIDTYAGVNVSKDDIIEQECPKCGAQPGIVCTHTGKGAKKKTRRRVSHIERMYLAQAKWDRENIGPMVIDYQDDPAFWPCWKPKVVMFRTTRKKNSERAFTHASCQAIRHAVPCLPNWRHGMSDLITTIERMQTELGNLLEQVRKDEDMSERDMFRKFDLEKRLVYAEVYLPDMEDAHGHSMTAEEIEKMAHGFMKNRRTTSIDLNHDNNVEYGCAMVESFIARDGDPDYMPGAWVGVVKVENDEIWKMIKDGEITGFSFEGMGYVVEE